MPDAKKRSLEKELHSLSRGVATEAQVAYEIGFYFGQTKNIVVIHDLRLEINGRVAQIDHLLINRCLEVYVLETKTFGSGLSVNEAGKFSTSHEGREIGIPSPIEQNQRHISVLRDAFKEIGLPTRLGIPMSPSFHSVVLISPKAVIRRPMASKVDLSSVIKSDQFFSWYNKTIDETKLGDVIGVLKVCSPQTIQDLAAKLVELHRPLRTDYVKRFDLADALLQSGRSFDRVSRTEDEDPIDTKEPSKYFCAACRISITNVVAKFCWNHKPRFGGRAYCRPCQAKF